MRVASRWRRKGPEQRQGTMSLIDHLRELRHRLLVCVWALLGGAVVGFLLYEPAMELIQQPYCDFLRDHPDKNPFPEQGCSLVFLGAIDGFLITVKVILFLALVVALPVILYQLWAFIVPGLSKRERRMAIPFVLSAVLLFALGALFAYWSLPRALTFLLGFAGDQFTPVLAGDRFISFVMIVALTFGLAFEFPVALVFLIVAGVISTDQLRGWRRGAILFIAVFAAVITPSSDPFTMLAMTIPMVLFYEAAIIVGRLMKR